MNRAERLAVAFATQVGRWALSAGASADLATLSAAAAGQLSRATSDGHVCIRLAALTTDSGEPLDGATWRRALLAAGVTGTAALPGSMPMVIDDDDRLYLHRYFDLERRLAARLLLASQQPAVEITPALASRLADLFPHPPGTPDWQQLAAALALRQHLTVISGGPGTGKTTTVARLLACLLAQNPRCRIMLAAPTGKAAARLHEALRERAQGLPEALRLALPATASTVHRLLGVTPGGFLHHAGRRLPLDVLVVDEASMLDLALASRLLDAVPEGARIILLGDQHQLAAVESGAVFAELSADPTLGSACIADLAAACSVAPERLRASPPTEPGALPDSTVWLRHNFRFATDSGIGRVVAATQRGDVPALQQAFEEQSHQVRWIDDAGDAPGDAARQAMRAGLAPYFEALRRDPRDHGAAWAAFGRFRVLCALRDGPRGVTSINEMLLGAASRTLQATDPHAPSSVLGRPVMVLRNDALLGLFNGDIGLLLPGDDGTLGAVFVTEEGPGTRWLPTVQLPEHETAFAMTVHKAQGSEFDDVLLLLPAQPHRVLSRELLYTALSRARQRITVVAPMAVIAAAAAAPTQRLSGLRARLREGTRAPSR